MLSVAPSSYLNSANCLYSLILISLAQVLVPGLLKKHAESLIFLPFMRDDAQLFSIVCAVRLKILFSHLAAYLVANCFSCCSAFSICWQNWMSGLNWVTVTIAPQQLPAFAYWLMLVSHLIRYVWRHLWHRIIST